MATSSKVQFKLETLKEKALESINLRITQKQELAEGLGDDAALAEDIRLWRARQEAKISDLFRVLGDGGIDDYQLSKFKLDPIPKVDSWERSKVLAELRQLESLRSKIVAKTDSLVPDADGNISLTKTQLAEFFGL